MLDHADRLAGTLLGTALGDALGLPAEGLSAQHIARRFGTVNRFYLLGTTGFVSDDTEQSALVAQSLARFPTEPTRAALAFRRSLVGWFLRLPYGIGWATMKACVRALVGVRRPGVASAGNGAAMRAAIIGAALPNQRERRDQFAREIAEVTHTDPRAIEGAQFVAAFAAACARSPSEANRFTLFDEALPVVHDARIATPLREARRLAEQGASTESAARALGTTGFVVHTVPFAAFCFLRFQGAPLDTLSQTIAAGGDTDSIGAIVGGWLGALFGASGLPADLIARLSDGPFGPSHLRALAQNLATPASPPARYSPAIAMIRNLALMPVIIGHGVRRLLPS